MQCIISQSYTYYEWIIVNDGSTEPLSLQYINNAVKTDNRIKLINHDINRGLPAARNTGITHSKGKYIFFIDADDLLDRYTLEKMKLTLDLNPGLSFVNSYVEGFGSQNYLWKGGFHDKEIFLKENRNTSCFMGRNLVIRTIGFDESLKTGGEDWDFWLHAASKGFWGYTIPEFLFKYRREDKPKKWQAFSSNKSLKEFTARLIKKYKSTLEGSGFPDLQLQYNEFEVHKSANIPVASDYYPDTKSLLVVLPWLQIGGADQFNLHLLKGLKEKGWKITIACTMVSDHKWFPAFQEISPDIFLLPNYSTSGNFYQALANLFETRSFTAIFLSNSRHGYYLLPWLKSAWPSVPVVDFVHCEDPGWFNGGYPMFSTVTNKLLDLTFVTSNHLKTWMVDKGADETNIIPCYINVNHNKVARNEEIRRKYRNMMSVADNTPVILYTARLTPQKQPFVLLDTISRLYKKNKNFKCVIIGDGPEYSKLEKQVARSSARKNIILTGALNNDEVMSYMDAADIFFLPSKFEGIALTIYEAMAKSLSILGADVGGQSELVTPECGKLIKSSYPETEAEVYYTYLLDLITNNEKIKQQGKHARERICRNFTLDQMIGNFDYHLNEVIQSRRRETLSTEIYLPVLNRLLFLEDENDQLRSNTNRHFTALLHKYRKVRNKLEVIKVKWSRN